ncbi:hypothetical protein IFM46972_00520 [Aspergillus udagawae]|uniref:Uncharacterized protein n=1 Tax=Aspergillus udagawae TaxID=91492 RepID=A0A8H3N1S3_9EURO|nr:hypothetical protein IFM46972_00520 [Aspergillus udagawae]
MSLHSPPPQYGTDKSPPSYDELMARVEAEVGKDPTPEKYLQVVGSLNDQEIDILADSSGEGFPPVESEEDLKALKRTLAREMQSDFLKASAKASATEATEAAVRLYRIFDKILQKIIELDAIEVSGFEPEMRGYLLEYDAILQLAGRVALDMEPLGEHFDKMLLPVCYNDKVSKEAKRQLVDNFLKDTAQQEKDAREAQKRIRELKENFNRFVAKFDDWGKDKEGELLEEIKQLQRDIQGLRQDILKVEKEIEDLQFVMKLVSSLSLIGLLFGGWTALIIGLVGVIGVAATAAAISAKQEKIKRLNKEILAKEGKIQEKEQEIKLIQEARSMLTTLRDSNLDTISADILLVDNFWQRMRADTFALLDYVEDGTAFEYIEDVMEYGIETYKDLGVYVADYGRNVLGSLEREKKKKST